jgi:glycine betaine/choline ABC-type transport system substrate-binding protein
VRSDSLARWQGMREAITELRDSITDTEMRKMNNDVDVNHRDIADVAREFLAKRASAAKVAP